MDYSFHNCRAVFKFDRGDGIFFSSDHHLWHSNILKFCNRPYDDVEQMNADFIRRWNAVVKSNDIVFYLGDFCFGGEKLWNAILDELRGHIYMLWGNHDVKHISAKLADRFEWCGFQAQIYVEKKLIYLNHYPFLCFSGSYREEENMSWQLFGHVHTQKSRAGGSVPQAEAGLDDVRMKYLFPTQYDVGVDNNNYAPVSYFEVKDIIGRQLDEWRLRQSQDM